MAAHLTEDDGVRRDDTVRADLREAYERGRKDARAGRKRHPVLMTFTVVAAIVGVVLLALAAINGSFGQAGRVVDQNLAVAADRAEPVVRDAADDVSRTMGGATPSEGTAPADAPG